MAVSRVGFRDRKRRRRRVALFGVLLCGAVASPSRATDYFLGDSAAQQPGIALADIAALNELSLEPGDGVYFAGGETFEGMIELGPDDAGTPDRPVLISSYGTGRATVHGGHSDAVMIYNAAGFIIRNLDLQGSGATTNEGAGVSAGVELPDDTKFSHLRFEGMRIMGFKKGVEIWAWYGSGTPAWPGFRDVALTDLEISNNLGVGIEVSGSWVPHGDGTKFSHENLVISRCLIWNNRGDPAATQSTGSGIVVGCVDGATVEDCVAHDNGGVGPATGGGPFGIWAWESRGVRIQYNLVYNQQSSSAVDGGAYDLDGGCSNSVIQYNYSHHNEGPAVGLIQFGEASPSRDNVVRFNISEDDCRGNAQGVLYVGDFSETHPIRGAEIYHNTFFVSAGGGGDPPAVTIDELDDRASVHLRNNLFIATHTGDLIAGATLSPGKALFQGNNYWGGRFDLARFRTEGQEMLNGMATGSRLDPRLHNAGQGGALTEAAQVQRTSAYQLMADSPLIGRGLNLTALFGLEPGRTDFYGVPLAASLSVGASQHVVPTGSDRATLANISVRAFCGTGNAVSIAGLVITGRAPKTVLLRAVGPSLASAGLSSSEVLADPVFALHDARQGNAVIATNDNWTDNPNVADIRSTTARVGATPLGTADTKSAALLITLNPGVYSCVVSGQGSSTGIVLTEVYDADMSPGGSILANLSGRVICGTGNNAAIGGFVISGAERKEVLVRAVGPSLATAGLSAGEVLSDPTLTLYDALRGNVVVARNDNGGQATNAAAMLAAAKRVGASPLAASDTQSAVLLIKLAPGVYSFVVSHATAGSGVVVTEIYDAD